MLQATSRLRQLPNMESGHNTSDGSKGGFTHQFESVDSSVFVQVVDDIPVRDPTSYDGEADPPLWRDTRDFKDGN